MDMKASHGSGIRLGGDGAGRDIVKNAKGDEWRLYAERTSAEFQLLRQKCEQTERDLRRETKGMQERINHIQNQRINDMKRLSSAIIAVLVLGVGVTGYSLMRPEPVMGSVDAVQALNQYVLDLLEAAGEPVPLPTEHAQEHIQPEQETHCIVEAVSVESETAKNEPVCFDTLSEALHELANATGYDYEALVVLLENAKGYANSDGAFAGMPEYAAVVGVWFTCPNYGCSSTVVYGGSNGCYDGSTWGVPIITQTVASALKMGGCWNSTIHSGYYFSQALQYLNAPTVGLSSVKSAKYSP